MSRFKLNDKLTHKTQRSEEICNIEMYEVLRNKFRNVFEINYLHLLTRQHLIIALKTFENILYTHYICLLECLWPHRFCH